MVKCWQKCWRHPSNTPSLHVLSSVNAKQLAQPAFQVGPNRCKSDHGRHSNAECGTENAEQISRADAFDSVFQIPRSAFLGALKV